MAYPVSPYIEERDGGLYVAESRVSLDTVVINFQHGESPDQIVRSFSTLKLSHVSVPPLSEQALEFCSPVWKHVADEDLNGGIVPGLRAREPAGIDILDVKRPPCGE